MQPTLYSLYVRGLENTADAGLKEQITECIETNKKDQSVNLTIKNYKVGGLSQAIHERGKYLAVSGPMGRSLGVDLSGINVAFAAGTGVLPFIDLVGYIARHTLGITNEDSTKPGDGFHFWFNVRLNSREAIADDLCSALATANPAQFRYDVVKKNPEDPPSSSRWTAQTIEEKLN